MNRLLTLQYYFTSRPDPDFQFTKITVILIILFFATSIGLQIYRRKYLKDSIAKKIIKRYPSRLIAFGVILLGLLLSREAAIPYVSMRLWWFLLLIFIVYWTVKNALNFKSEYSKRLKKQHHNTAKSKYLPKKKR